MPFVPSHHKTNQKGVLPRRNFFSPQFALIVLCSIGLVLAPPSQAQTLSHADQAKINRLNSRYSKAVNAHNQAVAALGQYRIFRVMGKVEQGDDRVALVYGKVVPVSDSRGAGTIDDDNFFYIKSPVKDDWNYGNYDGYCTFIGLVDGRNTYWPLAVQGGYLANTNSEKQWTSIIASIQAEKNAVYAPYRQREQARKQALREAQWQKDLDAQARKQALQEVQEKKDSEIQEQRKLEADKKAKILRQRQDEIFAQSKAEYAKKDTAKDLDEAKRGGETQERLADVQRGDEGGKTEQPTKQGENDADEKGDALESLRNNPSLIAGKQLGKVEIGMTEAQVMEVMAAPNSIIQVVKETGLMRFTATEIRRFRYVLKAVDGLPIFYNDRNDSLSDYLRERGLQPQNDTVKREFVLDVYFYKGKVFQIETDSPQFFTADKLNIINFQQIFQNLGDSREYGYANYLTTNLRYYYGGSLASGLSWCIESSSSGSSWFGRVQSPDTFKLIIHAPNVIPMTGNNQGHLSRYRN